MAEQIPAHCSSEEYEIFQGDKPISSLDFVKRVLEHVIPEEHRPDADHKLKMVEDAFMRVQHYGFEESLTDDTDAYQIREFRSVFLDTLDAYEEQDTEFLDADPEVVASVSTFLDDFFENYNDRMTNEVSQVALRMLMVVLEPKKFKDFK